MKKLQLRITGGIGRNILGTAVVKQLRSENPDAIIRVMASYPDIFQNSSFGIDRIYAYSTQGPDFRDVNKDFDILEVEPYSDLSYRIGKEHIIDVWCRKLGLKTPESLCGYVFLTDEEKQWAQMQKQRLNTKAPIVAIQISGGVSSYAPNDAYDILKPKQIRSLPIKIAQAVVEDLSKKGFLVMQIGLPSEPRIQGALFLEAGNNQVLANRLVIATLDVCDYFIGIDSFGAHARKALGKVNDIIMWGSTNPTNLGYSSNTNLTVSNQCSDPHCNRPDGVMMDVDSLGKPWQCPYKGKCMDFDPKEIISALMAVVDTKKENPDAK